MDDGATIHHSERIDDLEREVAKLRIDRARWRMACQAAYRMNKRARAIELAPNRWWRHFRYRLAERGWWALPFDPKPLRHQSNAVGQCRKKGCEFEEGHGDQHPHGSRLES